MSLTLHAEEIFDSAVDDAAFEQLSSRLAEVLGARSGVLHWRLREDIEEQEVSYSGYFSPADMAQFEGDFARDDLWAVAVNQRHALNRVWNLEELVSRAEYENSRIYNEWIRAIGDDTMHALGAVIHTPDLRVEIGFHRGKAQPAFDADAVAQLAQHLPAIRRMAQVRQKLRATRNGAAASALDMMGHAAFTLSPQGRVLHMNHLAEAMLCRGDVLTLRQGQLRAKAASADSRLATVIRQAAAAEPLGDALILHGAGGESCSATLVPARTMHGRHLILLVSDARIGDATTAGRLRALYGLSHAEADVALLLAEGLSPAELAEYRATSIGTVRAQIKAVAAKMGVGRQSEIVRTVLALPKLAI